MAFRGMPAPDVLAQMDTIPKVMDFVRLNPTEQDLLLDALGADPETHPAELAMLTKADFDDTVSSVLPACSALGRSRIGWLWAYLQEVAKHSQWHAARGPPARYGRGPVASACRSWSPGHTTIRSASRSWWPTGWRFG